MRSILRVIQKNVRQCLALTQEVRALSRENRADVVMIQEPYDLNAPIRSVFESYRQYFGSENRATSKVVTAIGNPKLKVDKVSELCSERSVVLKIESKGSDLVHLVNFVCPREVNIDQGLAELHHILTNLNGKLVIVATDMYARSKRWNFLDSTDERGKKLENFLKPNDLHVVHYTDGHTGLVQRHTLRTAYNELHERGVISQNHTDLTLVNDYTMNRVIKWETLDWCRANKCPPSSKVDNGTLVAFYSVDISLVPDEFRPFERKIRVV